MEEPPHQCVTRYAGVTQGLGECLGDPVVFRMQQGIQPSADQLCARVTEQAAEGVVGVADFKIWRDQVERDRGVLRHCRRDLYPQIRIIAYFLEQTRQRLRGIFGSHRVV